MDTRRKQGAVVRATNKDQPWQPTGTRPAHWPHDKVCHYIGHSKHHVIGHTLTTKGQREAQGGNQPFFPLGAFHALRFRLHAFVAVCLLEGEPCMCLRQLSPTHP